MVYSVYCVQCCIVGVLQCSVRPYFPGNVPLMAAAKTNKRRSGFKIPAFISIFYFLYIQHAKPNQLSNEHEWKSKQVLQHQMKTNYLAMVGGWPFKPEAGLFLSHVELWKRFLGSGDHKSYEIAIFCVFVRQVFASIPSPSIGHLEVL